MQCMNPASILTSRTKDNKMRMPILQKEETQIISRTRPFRYERIANTSRCEIKLHGISEQVISRVIINAPFWSKTGKDATFLNWYALYLKY